MAERTPKQIAAGQRRSLRAQARKLGDEWADRDEGNLFLLHWLAFEVEDATNALYVGEED